MMAYPPPINQRTLNYFFSNLEGQAAHKWESTVNVGAENGTLNIDIAAIFLRRMRS